MTSDPGGKGVGDDDLLSQSVVLTPAKLLTAGLTLLLVGGIFGGVVVVCLRKHFIGAPQTGYRYSKDVRTSDDLDIPTTDMGGSCGTQASSTSTSTF